MAVLGCQVDGSLARHVDIMVSQDREVCLGVNLKIGSASTANDDIGVP